MNLIHMHQIQYKGKEIFFHMVFQSSVTMHDHMYDAPCFIYAINAEGSVSNGEGSLSLSHEEGALMRCGSYINRWNTLQPNESVEVIVIKLLSELVFQIFSEIDYDPQGSQSKPSLTLKADQDVLLRRYMEGLLFYFNNPTIVTDDMAYLKLKELVLLLLQLPDQDRVKSTLLHLFRTEKFTVLQVVENHLFENFTVEQLAHFAHMSKTTFQRKFKQYTGLSVRKYILTKRLDQAYQLLKDPNKSVAEICFSCGFTDPNYFSKVFKQKFGKTPRGYRLSV